MKSVSYILSANELWSDKTPISLKWNGDVFLWVQVIWILQWSGKSDFTWQEKNFSDISKAEARSVIEKNAFTQIKYE